jgi:hypothetical protein
LSERDPIEDLLDEILARIEIAKKQQLDNDYKEQ